MLLASLGPVAVAAPSAQQDHVDLDAQIDALIDDYRDDNDIPGISVAVIQDGAIIYADGSGLAEVAAQDQARAESVYNFASVSKVIGATLTAKLEAENPLDLNLDDVTSDHLPDGISIDEAHIGSHTLRDLLTHRGCVVHYSTEPEGGNPTTHFATATEAAETVFADLGLI